MRTLLLGSAIAAIGIALAGGGPAGAQEKLTIVSWGGIVNEANRAAYWDPFTKETGIEIVEDAFNGELGKIRAQVESGNIQWDIAVPEYAEEALGCIEGLFQPLDHSMLPMDQLPEGTVTECGVTSLAAGTVLAYNKDKYPDGGPQSWADFWDVEKFPGKRGVNLFVTDTLVFALLADGVALEEVYDVLGTKEGQDRAFAKLDELKPHIVWWTSGTEQIQGFLSGEYDMGVAWNGRVAAANAGEDIELEIVWEAGYLYGGNRWAILEGTPNYDAAMKFIAFATQPEPQAEFMRHINYGSINEKAYDLLEPEQLEAMPGTAERLPYAVHMNGEFWLEHLDAVNERFNRWVSG
jgi:putative spermidine/putrescine transport system substrate-binding protein